MDPELTARRGLIDQLTERGSIRSDRVREAFGRIRRSAFLPGTPLDEVYAPDRTHTVAQDEGVRVSTVSAPWIQAAMLELLALKPGEDVLEIGSGGTNAALLAEMVASGGSVWTVDIDERVIDRARSSFQRHPAPVPVRADVIDAWAPGTAIADASFDAVEFTVDTWTFPDWLPGVLRPGGRVVAPMGFFSIGCVWVFTVEQGRLLGRRPFTGGFVAARGAGADAVADAPDPVRSGNVWLGTDTATSADWLESVLSREEASVETGVLLAPGTMFLPVFLRLLCGAERAASIWSDTGTREHGYPGASGIAMPVWLADDGMAVMDSVRGEDDMTALTVRAFGSEGPELAERMAERLRSLPDAEGEPVLEVFPVGQAPAEVSEGTRVFRRGDWELRLSREA